VTRSATGDAIDGMTPIEHDPDHNRFVARLERGVAHLSYERAAAKVLDLQHTVVPRGARGRGVGEALVQTALDYARDQGLRVIPTCPFVSRWIAAHPDYEPLVLGARTS
jgi:predicted GNAT family acetyltransferase